MKQFLLLCCLAIGSTAFAQQKIKPEEAAAHVGDSVQVCGKVFGGKYLGSHLTLLDMGGLYPDNTFTVVMPATVRDSLQKAPETAYKNQYVCFTGKIVLYREKPQLVLSSPRQIVEYADVVIPAKQ